MKFSTWRRGVSKIAKKCQHLLWTAPNGLMCLPVFDKVQHFFKVMLMNWTRCNITFHAKATANNTGPMVPSNFELDLLIQFFKNFNQHWTGILRCGIVNWAIRVLGRYILPYYRVIGLKLIHFRLTFFSWLNDILPTFFCWNTE